MITVLAISAVSAGLVASWFGDLALSFKGTRAFLGGLVSFALAHALYTAGFFARSTMDVASVAFAAFLTAAMAVLILRWLSPHVPVQLRIPVAVYTLIIAVMVIAALGTSGAVLDPRIPMAAVLFAASDVLVARQRFVKSQVANRVVGLATYYAAQVLFAITVVSPPFRGGRVSGANQGGLRAWSGWRSTTLNSARRDVALCPV